MVMGDSSSTEKLQRVSSSEKLATLARKYFSSLIESAGQVYGSGELGTIPDIFPMLLMVVQEALAILDPLNRQPDIEPGLSVTLESLNPDQIAPSAFVSFTSKLRHGTFLVGSFSPVKYLNWGASHALIQDISTEIDELFDDFQEVLTPIEWRDTKYEIITNIINERAQLINLALNSRTITAVQTSKPIIYKPEQIMIAPIIIDYENLPYTAEIISEKAKFWSRVEDKKPEGFIGIIKAVLSASMEPIKQLNRDSITSADRRILFKYESALKNYTGEYTGANIDEIINDAFSLNAIYDKQVKNLFWRYAGMKLVESFVKTYEIILNGVLENLELTKNFLVYISSWLRRRYSLGIIKAKKSSFAMEFMKNIVSLFHEYQSMLKTLEKDALNRAIIDCDNPETMTLLENTKFTIETETFRKYIINWSEEFSGLLPEEINLRLKFTSTTGIIYIQFDYNNMRMFSTFLIESVDTEKERSFDLGTIREYSRKSIDKNVIYKKLTN